MKNVDGHAQFKHCELVVCQQRQVYKGHRQKEKEHFSPSCSQSADNGNSEIQNKTKTIKKRKNPNQNKRESAIESRPA